MRLLMVAVIIILVTRHSYAGEEAKFDAYVMRQAQRTGVTVVQIFRLWNVESGVLRDRTPDGKKGEMGRAQIMLSTARDYEANITPAQLREKWTNTRILFRHLRSLRQQLRNAGAREDLLPALMFTAYNRGIEKVLRRLAIGHQATSKYGRHVAWGR